MKKKLEELDFKLVFKILWDYRKTITISIFCFSFLGVVISFTTPFEYTAQTTVIPVESSSGSSNINQLASLAGFDLMSGLGDDQSISPNLYPTVVYSSPFLKELSDFKIKVEGFDNRILLKDYLYNYSQLSKIDIFKKDILKINFKNLESKISINNNYLTEESDLKYSYYTSEDKEIFEEISSKILISFDQREGLLYIQASMPDRISAAELAQKTTDLLQKKIIEFKIKKANNELKFLESRFIETQKVYNNKKNLLADFQDKNLNLISSRSNVKLNQLQSDFELTSNVFLQLSQQLESQKLKVKKETPVFSMIEPVSVPLIRSKPVRFFILKISIVIGLITGIFISIFGFFYKQYLN
ncbi:Wzz/FepE/Etk N-terminal domain-containing protein [Flavobacteriaceae bacterium]|nr:Wzz/FepE/Etk N-terminal domain-containing protein [Flavobacteriaceae bacterium]MDC3221357.1 Wzz/FepE/Etk N-terminal domain-containing protein [Flavobacteriaceae bacterium]